MSLLYVNHGARSWALSVGRWGLKKLVRAFMMFCRVKGDYYNTRAELGQGEFIRHALGFQVLYQCDYLKFCPNHPGSGAEEETGLESL